MHYIKLPRQRAHFFGIHENYLQAFDFEERL